MAQQITNKENRQLGIDSLDPSRIHADFSSNRVPKPDIELFQLAEERI